HICGTTLFPLFSAKKYFNKGIIQEFFREN
ncbi:MAG: hypothetical protein ACI9XO_004532, partial [Paraglaciecola sp.]